MVHEKRFQFSLFLDFTPSFVVFDEAQESTFLVHDLKSPEKRLFVSRDFGETFVKVQDYVKAFYMRYDLGGDTGERTTLYLQRMTPQEEVSNILMSTDYFSSKATTVVLITSVNEFEYRNGFLFATRANR